MTLIARLLHVGLGVFWAGTMMFATWLLAPAVQEVGPDGGKVMAALARRGMMTIMPIAAVLTLLSGLWLLWRVSAGFNPSYMGSTIGIVYSLGMLSALVAFGIGIAVVRPAMMQSATADPARAQALRQRGSRAQRVVAVLLVVTVVCMAIARYL